MKDVWGMAISPLLGLGYFFSLQNSTPKSCMSKSLSKHGNEQHPYLAFACFSSCMALWMSDALLGPASSSSCLLDFTPPANKIAGAHDKMQVVGNAFPARSCIVEFDSFSRSSAKRLSKIGQPWKANDSAPVTIRCRWHETHIFEAGKIVGR